MKQTFELQRSDGAPDTKTRILDAAERLFAQRGFDAASLRAITSAAGVNLAAVNYHFGSKDELIRAVFARRLGPLTRMRHEMLERYQAEAGNGPVPKEEIMRALLGPAVDLSRNTAGGLDNFRMLAGRMFAAPAVQAIFLREVRESLQRFRSALQRACPELQPEELSWRVFFIIGAMAHTLASGNILTVISEGTCDARDLETGIDHLIRFAAAGLEAGPSAPLRKPAGIRRPGSPCTASRGVKHHENR
jgi:AcrR family transcriptional regulator